MMGDDKVVVIKPGKLVGEDLRFECDVCDCVFLMPRSWILKPPSGFNPMFAARCVNCGCEALASPI